MHLLVGRYILVKQIGKGGFGAVEEYTDDITKENVAIKTIPARYVNQESRRLVREIDIMCFLHDAHPHVIGYYNIFATKSAAMPNHNARGDEDPLASTAQVPENIPIELNVLGDRYKGLSPDEQLQLHHEVLMKSVAGLTRNDDFNVHIVMPLMKGDLFYFIRLLGSQSSAQRVGVTLQFLAQVAVVFAFQICFGLDYLHQCAIIHRDMKPDNVLVRLDISNPYMSTALIADMGLARDAQHSDTIYICTRYYRPPEVITSVSGGSTRIDIWSLGCIFYEMCTGQTLFTMRTALNERGEWDGAKASLQLEVILNTIGTPSPEDIDQYMPKGNAKLYLQRSAPRPSQLRQLIERNWILQSSGDEKEKWIDLITRCVAFFPEQRPTAQQLCQHQLFRDYNVFYGSNVTQYPPTPYTPSFRSTPDSSRVENKQSILSLVSRALVETTPPENEEESSSDEESGSDSSDSDSESDSDSDEDSPQPPLDGTFDISISTQNQTQSNSAFNPPPRDNARANSKDANEESESGGKTSLFGVSNSASKSVSASGGAAANNGAASKGPAHLPSPQSQSHSTSAHHNHHNTNEFSAHGFLNDDDDDGNEDAGHGGGGNGASKAARAEAQQYRRALTSPGNGGHRPHPGDSAPRYSPGNIFRNSPMALLGKPGGPAPEMSRQLGNSASSEDSGPVIDDTPPLAPALAFKDRITRRKQSGAADEEEPSLGGTKPSVFNLENYRHTAPPPDRYDNEETGLAQSVVPQVLPGVMSSTAGPVGIGASVVQYSVSADRMETPPLTLAKGANYSYLSQYPMAKPSHAAAARTSPQPTSFYFTGMEGSTSLPRPGGSVVNRRISDANTHTVSTAKPSATTTTANNTTTNNGAGGAGQRGPDEEYDYFADGDYFISPTTSNVAAVATDLAKEQQASPYFFQLTGSGRADHVQPLPPPTKPAVSQQFQPAARQTSTPSLPRVASASFPPIANAELRRRYMAYRHTPRSVQAATSSVLEELGSCTHDAERSSELRELLNYFTSLQLEPSYAI